MKNGRVYHCAICGRRLSPERWVYSRFTGNRFCWPGECRKRRGAARLPDSGQSTNLDPLAMPDREGSKEVHVAAE